jgi:hypothetical protein
MKDIQRAFDNVLGLTVSHIICGLQGWIGEFLEKLSQYHFTRSGAITHVSRINTSYTGILLGHLILQGRAILFIIITKE